SLAEFPAYWGESSAEFAAISEGKTIEERQLRVTNWFLSTLSGQFTRRETETGSEKKPLNPILGEQHIGEWADGLKLWAEQVSHHPPVTAYHMENKEKGVSLEGHCAQKTSFSGRTIVVKQVGHAILTVELGGGEKETYLITLPKLKIEGLWYGAPYVELAETSFIQGSHGLTTTIEYKGKGYFSGTAHSFTSTISLGPSTSNHSNPIYVIEGTWTGTSNYVKGSPAALIGKPFLDATKPKKPMTVKPVEQMGEYESRRVWKTVAEGIREGDFEKASVAKSALENAERQKRKDELASGVPFKIKFFNKVENSPDYATLAALCKHKPEKEEHYSFLGAPSA
ncbi:hypothetical protein MNV49_003542, partial [Pseudohyphozyma bogoriensis]